MQQTNTAQREDFDVGPCLELIDEESTSYVGIGEVVASKYRVEEVLGTGGMAFVLAVEHVELRERFALKFLNEQFLADPRVIERFTQEAKAACRLRSEHIARVYDVGTHRVSGRESEPRAPFLVMEHLTGRDLATVVHESGPLPIESAVEYAMQACDALATAHRHGIVHRDIKPENLFLVEHEGLPSIKLLDFGISKMALAGAPASRLTENLSLGTPCYMAPEHIRATAAADARSDLWSLGAVLYELLAGVEAFQGPTVTEVCAAVLEQDPPPLTELRPEIPSELGEIVARCLEKDPARRFANVAELAAALLPFGPPRAIVSVDRTSSLMKVATPPHSIESLPLHPRVSAIRSSFKLRMAKTPGPGGRPSYKPVAAAALACVLVSVAGAAFALRGTRPSALVVRADPATVTTVSEDRPSGAGARALAPVATREHPPPAGAKTPEPKAATRAVASPPQRAKTAGSAHAIPSRHAAAQATAPVADADADADKATASAGPTPTVELGY